MRRASARVPALHAEVSADDAVPLWTEPIMIMPLPKVSCGCMTMPSGLT